MLQKQVPLGSKTEKSAKIDTKNKDLKIENEYENLPDDFDWKIYILLNEDIKNFNETQAKNHYITFGFYENRKYKNNIIFEINTKNKDLKIENEYKNLPGDFDW